MSLVTIREVLIENWPRPAVLRADELAVFEEQIRELRGAHKAGLWKSTCLLAGQVIEALLTKRLQLLEPPPSLDRVTGIGQLINLAYARGIATPMTRLRTGAASLVSARILRNWSAHYSLASRSITELGATQALALSFSATVSLFPLPVVTHKDFDRRLFALFLQLLRTPIKESLSETVQAELSNICKFSAMLPLNYLVHALSVMRRRQLDERPFADGIEQYFDLIVARVPTASATTLKILASRTLSLGLREHGRVLSVLLPIDASVICAMSAHSSPASVAIYVQHAYRADPNLFRAKCAQQSIDTAAIDSLWAGLAARNAGVENTVHILKHLPIRTRTAIMCRAPTGVLAQWLRAAPVTVAVKILQLVKEKDVQTVPQLRALHEHVLRELIESARNHELATLAGVPNVLTLSRRTVDNSSVTILDVLLQRVDALETLNAGDAAALRRMLWDIYTFCDVLADRALASARRVFRRLSPCWDAACLLGMLCSGFEMPRVMAKDPDAATWLAVLDPPSHATIWEKYLAFLAASSALGLERGELPIALLAGVINDPLPEKISPRSSKLRDRVASVLGGTG